ncbi:hypothetical protein SDC9_74522 [bioreactor metagenome]|uniref:YgjP-like metallopeptidase domain-containing protein n=1 Tax=bioreactor metagenome TaxID=1076179 RepID=A0A644YHF1_9ZZZZ
MQITISGIPVDVQKKKIKNMHLYVLPPDGRVLVTAPKRLTATEIAAFVHSKLDWIHKQQDRIAGLPRPVPQRYETGETLFVWGKPYLLQVETAKHNSLTLQGDRAVLSVREKSTLIQREAFVKEWYREELKAEIAKYLPKWEQATGLCCQSWQTKAMKTRWGTCNPKTRKIWLSLSLAKKPVSCLEYVLLHELAHLKVQNHGPEFQAFLDCHMPGWRELKLELNKKAYDYSRG